jgi:nucleoside phosphorylase
VGWVCALPKEQTAAIAMLDERHEDLPKPAHDPNTYTLGSVDKHNVVITCLPEGRTGNSSAAAVGAYMNSAFPRIKFTLMVGIGGGIPPKVRLGDVVVSTPVREYPGVIQWDLGKAKENNDFERTGSLNNPPTTLLTALTKLQSIHALQGSRIQYHLDKLEEDYSHLKEYQRSELWWDVLFKADYGHAGQGTANSSRSPRRDVPPTANNLLGSEHVTDVVKIPGNHYGHEASDSCLNCDKGEIVWREERKPGEMCVHYGLIASGNQVIKSGTMRDTLNKTFGGNLLCVEMEAAGLMNAGPCLVIRGICDYADSHKNDVWQEHAAAVAAAYAKELLTTVPPTNVETEIAAKEIITQGKYPAKAYHQRSEITAMQSC